MRTILLLLKPVIELALVLLPGLLVLALAVVWWIRRQSRPDRARRFTGEEPPK